MKKKIRNDICGHADRRKKTGERTDSLTHGLTVGMIDDG